MFLPLSILVIESHPFTQGIRRQVQRLRPLVCSFERYFRSAISRQIGRTCLVITLMVRRLCDVRIFSLTRKLRLPPGIISM